MVEFENLIGPKTKIVAVTHVSNALGTINPLERIIAKAHDAGALVVARSRGAMVKLLALETAQSQYSFQTIEGRGIKTPKDLEGKTTGGPQGDLHKTLFPAFAKINGIDMKKVKWVTMPPNAMIGSMVLSD